MHVKGLAAGGLWEELLRCAGPPWVLLLAFHRLEPRTSHSWRRHGYLWPAQHVALTCPHVPYLPCAQPVTWKTAPRGDKECPDNCNNVGRCNHDTGYCGEALVSSGPRACACLASVNSQSALAALTAQRHTAM